MTFSEARRSSYWDDYFFGTALVQRNGRIDRIGSPHDEIGIHNMFPEAELEALLRLVARLTDRLSMIDDHGLLDASVLGEVVHPRTFNTLKRIHDEDDAILDEEEARAELAGPEMLLKDLKEMLGQAAADMLEELPHGIHSGLRRKNHRGMFFYFQAPRSDGHGHRHYWRYIDAATHEVRDNRYEIAQLIACSPDEPRHLSGDLDVWQLQDKVIAHILTEEREVAARAAVPPSVDPIQQTVSETLKDAMRQRSIDRDRGKACLTFLKQAMGKAVHAKLRAAADAWNETKDDAELLATVSALAEQFGKEPSPTSPVTALTKDDLTLICFEYITA
jgi:hypothetical protein